MHKTAVLFEERQIRSMKAKANVSSGGISCKIFSVQTIIPRLEERVGEKRRRRIYHALVSDFRQYFSKSIEPGKGVEAIFSVLKRVRQKEFSLKHAILIFQHVYFHPDIRVRSAFFYFTLSKARYVRERKIFKQKHLQIFEKLILACFSDRNI